MRRTRTPSRASQRARTRPVGPAPTMRTCALDIASLSQGRIRKSERYRPLLSAKQIRETEREAFSLTREHGIFHAQRRGQTYPAVGGSKLALTGSHGHRRTEDLSHHDLTALPSQCFLRALRPRCPNPACPDGGRLPAFPLDCCGQCWRHGRGRSTPSHTRCHCRLDGRVQGREQRGGPA